MRALIEIILVVVLAVVASVKIVESRKNTSVKKLNKTLKNLHHNQKLNAKQIKYIKKELML